MSTRSGKRIHGSFHEATIKIDKDLAIKSERKTRKRQQKENCDDFNKTLPKSNKRNNYVTYPTDDEHSEYVIKEKPAEEKRIRKILRSTLKEQNKPDSTLLSVFEQDDNPKSTRSNRRTRKVADETTEEHNIDENFILEHKNVTEKIVYDESNKSCDILTATSVPVMKRKGKKKKKSKTPVPENYDEKQNEIKKVENKFNKKKKKNKRLLSLEKESLGACNIENGSLNKRTMSIDSFHSAAGSPNHHTASTNEIEVNITSDITIRTPKLSMEFLKDDNKLQDRKSSVKNSTYDKIDTSVNQHKLNSTFDKNSKEINTTYDKDDKNDIETDHNSTFETNKGDSKTKLFDSTFDKEEKSLDITYNKSDSSTSNRSSRNIETPPKKQLKLKSLDSTFDKDTNAELNIIQKDNIINSPLPIINVPAKGRSSTFDKEIKLDSTFEKNIPTLISPLISSDATNSTINVTVDKSVTSSPINITSDDSKTENILNATPVMLESSTDESRISDIKNIPEQSVIALKREGTFTKDQDDENLRVYTVKTPTKRMTLPSPGRTPFFVKSTQKDKIVVDDIKSVEKSRRSSTFTIEPPLRSTKVMFCSPIDNPVAQTERKNKIVKSSLKGSNKSFVFEENASRSRGERARGAAPRKRSLTQCDAGIARAKRSRREPPAPARAPLAEPTTPPRKIVKPAPSSEGRVRRTALPDFAALHARRFEQMESLSEFKERKARRARLLLTPPAQDRAAPAPAPALALAAPEAEVKKIEPEQKKLPTLESLRPGYTRFGFKMNVEANPFNISTKNESKVKYKPKEPLKRQPVLPSLAGVTSSRKEIAKNSVMREKSSTSLSEIRDGKRKEYRTIIKGVRTNRRFELQMKSRNING